MADGVALLAEAAHTAEPGAATTLATVALGL
jgi:hypothetical protein